MLRNLRFYRSLGDGRCFQCGLRLQSTGSASTSWKDNIETELQGSHGRQVLTEAVSGEKIPFKKAKIGTFFQVQPNISNQFLEDSTLRSFLRRHVPEPALNDISSDLERFGERVATDIRALGEQCEREPPHLRLYNAWGRRVDEIITCQAWKEQKKVSAEEGLISTAYTRKHGQWSRVHQLVKIYLYSPSSGLYSCPLAMTDGAAKICEELKDDRLDHAYKHLISTDPNHFWTSGQWMTERKGGSDVGYGTETMAVRQADGTYKLYGYKWFSSATDSDMTFTLARIVDGNGQVTQGSKGVSMFYLEIRDPDGNLNNIEIQRLKDKLGTRQVPTAELLLDGTKAFLVSEDGRGVASISTMLTITRIHNSLSSAAGMKRIINLARDYCGKRTAFGSMIGDHNLHIKTLAKMEVEQRAALLFTLEMSRLLGKDDMGTLTETESNLLRLLTPVCKLYTAKQAVAVASEGLECFGGMGYLEDTFLPSLLRDAQVLPIWEGTTNILSLDVLRAIIKSGGSVLKSFHSDVTSRCTTASECKELKASAEKVKMAADQILVFAATKQKYLEVAAREFAFSIARIYMGSILLDHASWKEATPTDVLAANRWCSQDLTPVITELDAGHYSKDSISTERLLVFDGYPKSKY